MWSHPNGPRFERIVVPTPYKVGPANVYVFPDDPITLFDCGPNTRATENALILGLAQHGLHLKQIARVVISHGHPDHYGLAPLIREASGAEICIGEHDAAKLGGDSVLMATGRLLLEQGMPMEELVDMGERERGLGDLRPTIGDLRLLRGGDGWSSTDSEWRSCTFPGTPRGTSVCSTGPAAPCSPATPFCFTSARTHCWSPIQPIQPSAGAACSSTSSRSMSWLLCR